MQGCALWYSVSRFAVAVLVDSVSLLLRLLLNAKLSKALTKLLLCHADIVDFLCNTECIEGR